MCLSWAGPQQEGSKAQPMAAQHLPCASLGKTVPSRAWHILALSTCLLNAWQAGQTGEWMDGQKEGMDGWIDEQTDAWMDE